MAAGFKSDVERSTVGRRTGRGKRCYLSVGFAKSSVPACSNDFCTSTTRCNDRSHHGIGFDVPLAQSGQFNGSQHGSGVKSVESHLSLASK